MHDNPFQSPGSSEFQPPNPAWSVSWGTIGKIALGLLVLLVVVALLLPARRGARSGAYRMSCRNQLKQIGLALEQYHKEHGTYPPAYTVDANGRPLHSWRTLLLPYLEEEMLYKTIDLTKPWDDPVNERAMKTVVNAYECPSHSFDSEKCQTTYLAIISPQSILRGGKSATKQAITDGLDKTVIVIEVPEDKAVPWMSPQDADETTFVDFMRADHLPPNPEPGQAMRWSHMGTISHALFADGHIEDITPDAKTPAERRALITIAGGD
jgi:prepilin-type processing-associated H-X9-DG protein